MVSKNGFILTKGHFWGHCISKFSMISFSIDKSHVCFIIFPVVLASWVAMHITKTLPLKLTVSFILAVLAFSAIAPFFFSQAYAACNGSTWVSGYWRNGSYVSGHMRSCPNSTVYDNYSYKGNTNPYTGSIGRNSYGSSS